LRNPAGAKTPFYLLPGLNVEVSASQIRVQAGSALASGAAGLDVLPAAVSDYIRSRGLYR
jgi:hypothetical protein